jgi:hypothetical protein
MSASQEVAAGAAAGPEQIAGDEEENIYEVMKGHMRRQKEELEAKNAELRQARGAGYGRPGPAAVSSGPVVEKVADVGDMARVWGAVRTYLASGARYLDSVLGHCSRLETLNRETGEAVLMVPANQQGFTNEKARLKIEEALKAVTGLPVKLAVRFGEEEGKAAERSNVAAAAGGGGPAATRVAPEVIEAVKKQAVVKELMKKLDATVVNIEVLGGGEE